MVAKLFSPMRCQKKEAAQYRSFAACIIVAKNYSQRGKKARLRPHFRPSLSLKRLTLWHQPARFCSQRVKKEPRLMIYPGRSTGHAGRWKEPPLSTICHVEWKKNGSRGDSCGSTKYWRGVSLAIPCRVAPCFGTFLSRSEEHTSELQSHS